MYVSLFFLLLIILIAAFTPIPFFVLMALKAIVVLSFAMCLTMALIGIANDYYQREINAEYFWLPYIKDLWREYFITSEKNTAHIIKVSIGLLLFAAVVTLLVCTAGVGMTIPVVTGLINFTGAIFASVGIGGGAAWFTATFLGVLAMATYDAICGIIENIVDAAQSNQLGLDSKTDGTDSPLIVEDVTGGYSSAEQATTDKNIYTQYQLLVRDKTSSLDKQGTNDQEQNQKNLSQLNKEP